MYGMDAVSHPLVDDTELFKNVVHAVFLQHLTGVGLCQALNRKTVLLIHVTLHVMTTGLFNCSDIQQV